MGLGHPQALLQIGEATVPVGLQIGHLPVASGSTICRALSGLLRLFVGRVPASVGRLHERDDQDECPDYHDERTMMGKGASRRTPNLRLRCRSAQGSQ